MLEMISAAVRDFKRGVPVGSSKKYERARWIHRDMGAWFISPDKKAEDRRAARRARSRRRFLAGKSPQHPSEKRRRYRARKRARAAQGLA